MDVKSARTRRGQRLLAPLSGRKHRFKTFAASTAVLAALMPSSAFATSTSLWRGFESGTTLGFSSVSNVSVAGTYARWGNFGARVEADSDRPGYLVLGSHQIASGERYGRIRGWVKIDSYEPGQSVSVLTLQNANGSRHFDVWRDARTGKWRYDLFNENSAYSTMDADVDQWYYIEALVDFGGLDGSTYSADVRINGVVQPKITATSQAGSTVYAAWFGTGSIGQNNVRHYDALAVDVSASPFSFTQ